MINNLLGPLSPTRSRSPVLGNAGTSPNQFQNIFAFAKPASDDLSVPGGHFAKQDAAVRLGRPVDELEGEHAQMVSDVEGLVMTRLETANTALSYGLIATAAKILLSAIGDIQWAIKSMKKDMAGRPFSAAQSGLLNDLASLEKRILREIKQVLGIDLSDKELSALTNQQEPAAGPKDTVKPVPPPVQGGNEKNQSPLKSALKKVGTVIKKLLQEVAQLLQQVQGNPQSLGSLYGQIMSLLDRADGLAALETGSTDSYNLENPSENPEVEQMRNTAKQVFKKAQLFAHQPFSSPLMSNMLFQPKNTP